MISKSILWPTDFSHTAAHALSYAVEMANFYRVGLRILHVIPRPVGDETFMTLAITPEELANSMEEAAATSMRELLSRLDTNIAVETCIRHGDAAAEIIAEANGPDVGMVVLASHGYKGLKHFLHANVAEEVANGAQCPVLIVK